MGFYVPHVLKQFSNFYMDYNMPYSDILKASDEHWQPAVTIEPMMVYTKIGTTHISEIARLMIEVRGHDGSYSRSFTDRTINQRFY